MSTAVIRASEQGDRRLAHLREQAAPMVGASTLPTVEDWRLMVEMSAAFHKAGMFTHLRTPEAILVVILKGRELGLQPIAALSSMFVIGGKPALQAEPMRSIIYRDHGDDAFRILELTPERCTVAYKRRSWKEPETCTFTMEDAQRANLNSKGGNYEKYPEEMLLARCTSKAARRAFSDSLAGVYTPEDFGVHVTEMGVLEGEPVGIAEHEPVRPAQSRTVDVRTGEVIEAEPTPPVETTPKQQTPDSVGQVRNERVEVVAAILALAPDEVIPEPPRNLREARLQVQQLKMRHIELEREAGAAVKEWMAARDEFLAADPGAEIDPQPIAIATMRQQVEEFRRTAAQVMAGQREETGV